MQNCEQFIPWQFRRANQIVLTTLLCQSSRFLQLFSFEALKILFFIPLTKCLNRKFSVKLNISACIKLTLPYIKLVLNVGVLSSQHSPCCCRPDAFYEMGRWEIPPVFTCLWPASWWSALLHGTSSEDSWVQIIPSLQNKTPIKTQTSETVGLCEIKSPDASWAQKPQELF